MTFPPEILILSCDAEGRQALASALDRESLRVICTPSIRESLEILARPTLGLVFCDHELPDGTYRDFLAALRKLKPKVRVVVTSRQSDWGQYLEAMRLGAFEVIAAPCQSNRRRMGGDSGRTG
jgi:two-component system response regulator PilR (NtrC family)